MKKKSQSNLHSDLPPVSPFFDAEEQLMVESVEQNEWSSIPDLEAEKKRLIAYAQHALNKTKNINVRLTTKDVMKLKSLAVAEGIPYQTLVASVLHKYVSGRLVSKA